MCGILGFNWKDEKILSRALDRISHRGPDDFGKFSNKEVSLGHRRLSIIDLSKAGKQPMDNENGKIKIIFNGEIYNYLELKKSLKQKHRFRSETDSEVLIHMYEEEGAEMLNKLQGMFALCIYDMEKKILFLARDRVGKKPLYYYAEGKDFIFASEIKAMLETNKIKRIFNEEALPYYLAFRANTSNETFIKGIKKVPPGHFLIYDLKNNSVKIKKYWEIKFQQKKIKKKECVDKTLFLLREAVKDRLVSDVPYGAYLSGGVDSGAIVALMNKYSTQKPIKTFSVGFEEKNHSELSRARFLAKELKTDHHELVLSRNVIKELPKIVYQCDEPLADPTIIPTYFLARYNKKYCTVILTGEGADEIFAGYPQYKFMKLHKIFIGRLPKILRKGIVFFIGLIPKKILDRMFRYSSALGKKGLERFEKFVLSDNETEQYFNQIAIFNEQEQAELLKKRINLYKNYKKELENTKNETISQYQRFDFNNPMVEDLLMKVDKNTMAFCVEARTPFLDYRLVEFAASIPENMKLRGLWKDKYILREALKNILPKQTRKRKKKHFFVPIDSWMENELGSLINKFLSREYISKQGIFNIEYIEKIKAGFDSSRLFYARQLWTLIIFQIWYKQYIEQEEVKLQK